MLVHEDITGINTDIDALKRRMNEEFEQFQQYLKNEKKSFGELYTKVRHIERQAVDIKTEMLDPGSVEGFAESNTSHSKTSNPQVMMSTFARALAAKNPALKAAMLLA
jgi:hypothetical protein